MLGKDILPKILGQYKIYSYNFIDEKKKRPCTGATSARLRRITKPIWTWWPFLPVFNLYDKHWPIRT